MMNSRMIDDSICGPIADVIPNKKKRRVDQEIIPIESITRSMIQNFTNKKLTSHIMEYKKYTENPRAWATKNMKDENLKVLTDLLTQFKGDSF